MVFGRENRIEHIFSHLIDRCFEFRLLSEVQLNLCSEGNEPCKDTCHMFGSFSMFTITKNFLCTGDHQAPACNQFNKFD